MTDGGSWLASLSEQLPRHGEVVARLGRAVEASGRWRCLVVSCSLGSGRGDEFSDIDAGIGYAEPLAIDKPERIGAELVAGVGETVDVLVHQLDGWKSRRRGRRPRERAWKRHLSDLREIGDVTDAVVDGDAESVGFLIRGR